MGHSPSLSDTRRKSTQSLEGHRPPGEIPPTLLGPKRGRVLVHPVVNLDDRATQLSQPIQHGGDTPVVERRCEPVHRALARVRPDSRQFLSKHAPVGSERFDRVRASDELGENSSGTDFSVDQVSLGTAGDHSRGAFRQGHQGDFLAGPVESAYAFERHRLSNQTRSHSWLSAGRREIYLCGTSAA